MAYVSYVNVVFLGNLAYNIFKGPIEIILGITIGVLVGPLLWILPQKYKVSFTIYHHHQYNNIKNTRTIFIVISSQPVTITDHHHRSSQSFIDSKHIPLQHSAPQKNRFVLLSSLGLLSLFGLRRANFSGAGALGSLVLSFVAGLGWSESDKVRVEVTLFLQVMSNDLLYFSHIIATNLAMAFYE